MRCGRVNALMAVGFGLALQITPADAQHHGSKQKAQTPKSDAQLIASEEAHLGFVRVTHTARLRVP